MNRTATPTTYGCSFLLGLVLEIDTDDVQHAIEISYEGAYELDEPRLADGSMLDEHFNTLEGWVSSTLVRLGDLNLT